MNGHSHAHNSAVARSAASSSSASTAAPTAVSERGAQEHTTAATSAATSSPMQSQGGFAPASGAEATAVGSGLHQQNADALLQHIYQNGFCNAQFHDCIVHFHASGFTCVFHLHTLLLSRSPYLRQVLMSTHVREIGLQIDDPHITEASIAICIGYLYGNPATTITAENALSVLAAAYFLQLDELCQAAHAVCKQSISADNVQSYVAFARTRSDPLASSVASSGPGTPALGAANGGLPSSGDSQASSSTPAFRYGAYSEALNRATTDFLAKTLPVELQAFATPPVAGAQDRLVSAYAPLDFELFRTVAQHPQFPARSTQELFNFVKKCVAVRKKQGGAGGAALGEEQVVLAFGQAGGAVQVLRKPPKKLAKVGPHASAQ